MSSADDRVERERIGAPIRTTASQPGPLLLSGALQIQSGDSLAFDGPVGIQFVAQNGSTPTLQNAGAVSVTHATGDVVALYAQQIFNDYVLVNQAGGQVSATASGQGAVAYGVESWTWGAQISNAGHITATSLHGDSFGLQLSYQNAFTNSASGVVTVTAAEGKAVGADLGSPNIFWTPGGFNNAGLIEVSGQTAIGLQEVVDFHNTGTITVHSPTGGASAIALLINGLFATSYVNAGTIQSNGYAFYFADIGAGGNEVTNTSITNSGSITGDIQFQHAANQVHNTGSIHGAIRYGNANSIYDGAAGTQVGGIYMGYGVNTVTLGADGESVFGGGKADTITGGAGDDYIELFHGNNTVNGGGGLNTLSFSASDVAMSINAGTGTAIGVGTTSFSNIQRIIGSNFDDALVAGSTGVILIGGGGHDSLTGGSGADTLVASSGGAILAGGGGGDTFVFQAGGHQAVINDFKPSSEHDLLKVYGYASGVVSQQGADTLITLSATDSVLLKNVATASLQAGDIVYTTGAYPTVAHAPSPGVFGDHTLYFTYTLTITAAETLNFVGVDQALVDISERGTAFGPYTHVLDNFGKIYVSGDGDHVTGLYAHGSPDFNSGVKLVNEKDAVFSVTNATPGGSAMGFDANGSPPIVNKGVFTVSASGVATGIEQETSWFTNDTTGVFTVTSTGAAAYAYIGSPLAGTTNKGQLTVSGVGEAVGMIVKEIDSYMPFNNTGVITVSASGPNAHSVGVQVNGFGWNKPATMSNTGTITAGTAILEIADALSSPDLIISNLGTIHGDIVLAGGSDQVRNSGAIVGDVRFTFGHATYSGGAGTLQGAVYFGWGINGAEMGADGSVVFAGGGTNQVYGGDGDDFVEMGRGENTLDGGGGHNTLSLADAARGYTVDLAAGTADGAGLSSIANYQRVIGTTFNDTLKAGSQAAQLLGGAGNDTLVGGAAADTLTGGPGSDTLTGGGGADVFVYSAGDGQDVITDFKAGGAADVLKIYGFTAAQSVLQQGADTLITLGAGQTILLKNVTAASLAASDILYTSAPPPADPTIPAGPDIYFSSHHSMVFMDDLTIFAGEKVIITPDFLGPVNSWTALLAASTNHQGGNLWVDAVFADFINRGEVDVTGSAGDILGLASEVGHPTSETLNDVGSVFSVVNTGSGTAMAIRGGPPLTNGGKISATANGDATGVLAGANYYHLSSNLDTGVIEATSANGVATAVQAGAAVEILNEGRLKATGAQAAYGILGVAPVTNAGTITAVSASGHAYGIAMYGGALTTLTNSGVITAPTAILSSKGESTVSPTLTLINSGVLNGDVVIDANASPAQWDKAYSTYVTNTGTVNGNIHITQGWVSLDLRGGHLSGVLSFDPEAGGDLKALVTTDLSPVTIQLHQQASAHVVLSVDSQAGGQTALQFDIASTAANFHHNANGTWTIDAGADGTVTTRGVTTLHFTDHDVTLGLGGPAPGDLSHDYKSDVLWRNDSGEIYFWESKPGQGAFLGQTLGLVGADWHVQALADYNGDGRADILWRSTGGELYLSASGQKESGETFLTGQTLGTVSNQWVVQQAGADFNGDGRADILFRNLSGETYVWNSVAGGPVAFAGQSLGFTPTEWKIKGLGDFNGDGRADIVWRNDSGEVYLQNSAATGPVALTGQSLGMVDNSWVLQGVGDFNGDGRSDILWRNTGGEVYLWNSSSSGPVAMTGQSLGAVPLDWLIAGIGDYDGDGRADVLWRNVNGEVYVWNSADSGPVAFVGQGLGNTPNVWHIESDWHGL
jgi:Ca2+-binding RTX toxin-like protein